MSENRTLHRCRVCETPYTFGGPDPYLLPCLHSVCQTCHDADNTATIRCGICQEDFKRNDVGDTKDVVTTKQVLLATIQNNAGAVLCTNCNDGNQAMSWCQECEVFLCEHCQVSHEDPKVTRNHHVVALSELTCNFKGYTPQTKYCKIHAQYIEELFDENCGITLCAMCVLTHHKTCSTTTIINDDLAENTLKEGIVNVSERLSLVKDLEGKVGGLELDIECNAQDLKEQIKHTFGQLRSVLDQRENEVLLELEKCKEAEKASNASLRKLLQHEDSRCETLLHFIQSCHELCAPTEVLSLKKKIEAKIIANSATQLPQRIRQKSSITFSKTGLRDLIHTVTTFGNTWTAYSDSESDGFQRKAKICAKPEGTSLTKANSPQSDSVEPHPSGQIPQVQVPNLVNRAVPSSTSASTAKCVFQGKATEISIIGAKQEGIVKVVCFGAKRDGWVRMENLAENQILLNHDINTLKLVATQFNPQLVKWKRPHHEMKGGETVTLHFDNVELAQKLKLIIKKIQDAGKISEAFSPPKPVLATSPFTFTVKTTTTQAPRVSIPGFTFTQTKSTTPKAPVKTDAMKKGTGDGPSCASTVSSVFTLGQNTGSPMPSFSNVAANNSATGFSGLKTRQHSFQTTPSKGEDKTKIERYKPNVDVKPLIDLPDLVEMKMGEEDEEKVFGERARLFRFDADTNQWKERGIGEVKILFNKAAKRFRILMRREQVLKICANHNITKDMKLTPMTSSDRTWCWSAMDFAEEEMKMEKLAIRFKTPELAGQFKECFEKSQDMIEDSPVKPVPEAIGSSEVAQTKVDPKGKKSLSDMFKPKTGSWKCQGCYCVNKGEQLKCPACNTIKPGAEEKVKKAETTKPAPGISSGGFKVGEGGFQIGEATGGGGFGFGKKQEGGGFGFGSATSGGGFSFSTKPTQSPKDSPKKTAVDSGKEDAKIILKSDASTIGPGGFNFGGGGFKLDGVCSDGFSFSPKPSTPATPAKSEPADSTTGGLLAEMLQSNDPQPTTTGAASAPTSGFCVPSKSSGFNFASAADTAKKDGSGGFQFNLRKVSTPVKSQEKKESSSPFQFTFSLTPSKTPQAKASVTSPKSPEGDYYVNKDGEDSHIYFEPIVSLPDKVDVKTGEEGEIFRFEQRAELFKFSWGEWKERGLGKMKILEHKSSHRY